MNLQPTRRMAHLALILFFSSAASAALADEAEIRRNLAARMPELPKIDEVTKSPIPGIYELRIGHDLLYTDERGDHLINGSLFDTQSRKNLTEARIEKLTAIEFASLPLKDAIVIKQGTGARKLAVFADPYCGYCKRFERDLMSIKDVTIYTFLYPILGPQSNDRARDVWCAKDKSKAWRAWMLDGTPPGAGAEKCDASAIQRNVAFGLKNRVQGTPALVLEDGTRVSGAIPAAEVERRLQAAQKP